MKNQRKGEKSQTRITTTTTTTTTMRLKEICGIFAKKPTNPNLRNISRVLIFANENFENISRVFNFEKSPKELAKLAKISTRENYYPLR